MRGRFFEDKVAIFFLLGFLFLAVAFYPRYYLVSDEHHYARTSYLLTQGIYKIEDPLYSYIYQQGSDGLYSTKYTLGFPLMLAPFMAAGFDYSFLLNILLHLVASAYFYFYLKNKGINKIYAGIYLFYPFFIYYSLTLFSDYAAVALIMAFLYYNSASQNRYKGYIEGVIMALTLFVRPVCFIIFPIFYIVPAIKSARNIFKGKKIDMDLVKMLSITLPVLIIFIIFFLPQMSEGYSVNWSSESHFIFDNSASVIKTFLSNFSLQIWVLLVAFPLLILVAFPRWKKPNVLAALGYIFFMSFIDTTEYTMVNLFSPVGLVGGIRYLLPLVPLLLVEYVSIADGLSKKARKKGDLAIIVIVVMFFIVSAMMLFTQHQANSRNRLIIEDVYSNTDEGSLLISNIFGFLMHDSFGDRMYLGINDYADHRRDGTFVNTSPGHNISYSYIFENAGKFKTYAIINEVEGFYVYNSSKEDIKKLVDSYNGSLVYSREYNAKGIFFRPRKITVSLYALDGNIY